MIALVVVVLLVYWAALLWCLSNEWALDDRITRSDDRFCSICRRYHGTEIDHGTE